MLTKFLVASWHWFASLLLLSSPVMFRSSWEVPKLVLSQLCTLLDVHDQGWRLSVLHLRSARPTSAHFPGTSCSGVWDGQQNTNPTNLQRCCSTERYRVNVLRSLSCSQSIRQRIRCHFVFQSSWEFPDLGKYISRIVQIDLLSPLRKTPPLQRSMLSSSEASIQISQWGYQSEPPIPSCFSSRVGRRQNLCPRRMWSCQQVSVFEISALPWAFPPNIGLHVSTGRSRIHEAHSFTGPIVSLFLQDPTCLGPSMKVSYILLHHLYSTSDSVFRPVPVCFVVSLCGVVLTASVFVLHPDPLMMSGACLKSSSMSKYSTVWSNPNSKQTVQQQKAFHVWIFASKCSHVFRCVFVFEKTFECLSPSSSDKHTKSSPCTAILTSRFGLWNSAALCLTLRKPPSYPQIRVT